MLFFPINRCSLSACIHEIGQMYVFQMTNPHLTNRWRIEFQSPWLNARAHISNPIGAGLQLNAHIINWNPYSFRWTETTETYFAKTKYVYDTNIRQIIRVAKSASAACSRERWMYENCPRAKSWLGYYSGVWHFLIIQLNSDYILVEINCANYMTKTLFIKWN